MAQNLDRIHRGSDDPTPIPIQPEAAHKAFRRALASLPAAGGFELFVSAGSAPYEFAKEVLVDRPGVRLEFSPGAELRFSDAGSQANLFRCTAPGWTVRGARVTHTARADGVAPQQRSVFRVEDASATQPSDDARFVDCHFTLSQETPDLVGFSCIRAVGLDAGRPRRGLDVRATTFEFSGVGVRQSVAWQGEEPLGLCAIRASNSRECLLTRNLFRGELTSVAPGGSLAASRTGTLVYLSNTPDSIVSDCTFNVLDLIAQGGTSAGSVIRIRGLDGEPGHHTVLTNNVFEAIGARHVIELCGPVADVVANCSFGRVFDTEAPLAALPVAGGPRGGRGDTLVISGNDFHNIQPEHQIRLQEVADVSIDGNAFNLVQLDHKPLQVVQGSCANVHVGSSQVRTRPVK